LDIIPVAREVVFESISDAVIIVDEQNRILDLNGAAQRLAHCTASKAVGQPFAQVFAAWPELIERYLNMTHTYAEIVMREGEVLHFFSLRISPLHQQIDHLPVTGRLIVLHDMTQHMQAERSLRESEERFRRVFEEAPIGMAVVGLNGVLLQVNKVFCEMLGYREQELIRRSLEDITHPGDVGNSGILAAQVLKGVIASYKVEKRYLRKDGETLWADLTVTVIRNQDGWAIYRLVMLENIIERKRAKHLEEERHYVAYELHDGLAQVAASVHQHLQAFASHYHPRSPQAREELGRALELAQHSVREARRLIAGLRPTVLDDFGLATALRLLVERLRTEGWTVSYDETLGSERLPLTIETTLFGVAQEALTNARKHANTTQARVALERHESKIRLEVQDWGSGFEPLAVLRETYPGEHMGLRAMQERVELVGGHLTISSQRDVGTLVVVEVPLPLSDERGIYYEK
jgi:PAS domain S-box-containing protein